jgi:SAM-dependent methyltransferase
MNMSGEATRYLRPEEARQHEEALLKYRDLASRYDRLTARTRRWRERAVEALELEAGQSVVDVACGTGANFDLLLDRIGSDGRLVGVDLSGEMLTVAEARVKARDARNVELIEAGAENARLPSRPESALYSFAHDVLQSPRAVDNISSQLAARARIAAVGAKRPNRWNLPLNLLTRAIASRYVTSFQNFDRPWRELERHADLELETFALGAVYLASGHMRSSAGHG